MPSGVYRRTKGQTDRPTDRPTDRVFPVSAVDYPGLLATLEQQDRALEQEREDLAVIMAAVRKRAGAVLPAGLALPPARAARATKKAKSAPAGNGKSGHDKISPEQLATMRKLFESGATVAEICKRSKVSDATIYTRAKAGGWKRPKPGAAPAAAVPKGTALSGSVKCPNPECGGWTDYDPCRKCGQPLKRKW